MVGKEQEAKKTHPVLPESKIFVNNGRIILKLEMPGVTKEGINIKIDGNSLDISGKRTDDDHIKGDYLIKKRYPGQYYQITYTIDNTIDKDRIETLMQNGMLTVILTLKKAGKPRQITDKQAE